MKTMIRLSFVTLVLFVSSTGLAQLREFDGSPNEDFMPPFEENPIAKSSEANNSGRPLLGVALGRLSPEARTRYRMPFKHGGVLVTNVSGNSPAQKAGLLKNDIIVRCNGKYVYQPKDLIQIIEKLSPGQKVQMDVYRYGKWMPIGVKLGKREAAKPKDPFAGRKDHQEDTEDSKATGAHRARRIIMKLVREIRSLRKEVNELRQQVRQLQKKTGIAHSDSSRGSGRSDGGARDSSPPTVPPPAPEN